MEHPVTIAVVGAGTSESETDAVAEAVGEAIARAGATLVCGGLGGVMAAACKGAKRGGGLTVGLLPGASRTEANPFVDVALPTGMGEMRNALIVRAADAVIAIGGGPGTLSEIAFAVKTDTPVFGLGTWSLDEDRLGPPGIEMHDEPESAVAAALAAAEA